MFRKEKSSDACKDKNIADEKDIIFSLERVGLDPDSDKKVKNFIGNETTIKYCTGNF